MNPTRRSLVSALGLLLPVGLARHVTASSEPTQSAPGLRFRTFAESLHAAVQARDTRAQVGVGEQPPCFRIEIGYSPEIEAGVQGCHNDRPFAGFPAGHLRIVRVGSQPGPCLQGVRLYVTTIDVALTGGRQIGGPSRPLDFAILPAAPTFA